MGRTAGRNVNTKYNEYVDKKMAMEMERADASSLQDEEQEITRTDRASAGSVRAGTVSHSAENGRRIYSDEGVRRLEQSNPRRG